MEKRQHLYNALDYHLKEKYGKKVFKIALNGDFTCPNRDGRVGYGGCIFCSAEGSGDFAGPRSEPLKTQFAKIKGIMEQKWPDGLYIVYFQANSNTYGPLAKLKALFEEAISLDSNIVALSIATRCDCLEPEVLDYLEDLNERIPVWVELGLQTSHPETMKFLNLGYDTETFKKAVFELRKRNVETIAHIISGLPGETKEIMLDTVRFLNNLPVNGIKIHSLFLMKNTVLGKMYLENPFPLLTLEEYADIVSEQLALLREDIVVHRVSGDAPREELIEPRWSLKKLVVMNEIDKRMRKLGYFQGCKHQK